MVAYDGNVYSEKLAKFKREVARVEVYTRRSITKNLALRIDYRESLVRTYNDIITYFKATYQDLQLEKRLEIQTLAVANLQKLKDSFYILKLEYTFERNIFATIDIDKITEERNDPNSEQDSASKQTQDNTNTNSASSSNTAQQSQINTEIDSASDTDTSKESQIITETNSDSDTDTTIKTTNNSRKNSESSTSDKEQLPRDSDNEFSPLVENTHNTPPQNNNISNMADPPAQTRAEFIAIAHRMINYKFDGDPLALDSFIDAIELLEELCAETNKPTFVKFLMTRLEGLAREAIIERPTDTTEIIEQLRASIKTESSKVIEGRILALRADKTNLTKFAERAEELAEQYRRSLCDEGFSKAKAKEISIEKTVELCRKSARNDTVKAVIAAAKFSEPKEVIAKMIVEINNLKQDKGTAQYTHKYGNQNKNGNNFSNNRYPKQNNNRNHNNNSNNNRNGNRSGSQNNNNNYRQNYHNNNNNNNNRNGHNNYSNNNGRTFTNNNYRRPNEQSVRMISGNEMHPGNGGQSSDLNQ